MKIAIVSPYISTTGDLGYYQSQQINLAAELVKFGEAVDIITSKRNPDQLDLEVLDCGVRIIRLPVFFRGGEAFLRQPVMRGLWSELKRGQYDIIQSSEDFTLSTFLCALFVLTARSRLIIYQGVYCRSRKRAAGALMALYDRIAGPVLKIACSAAICKTSAAKRYLEDKGFKKASIIPVGVNTSIFSPNGRTCRPACELLSVGNLIPLKNFELLLDTFRILSRLNSAARLTIVGTGPEGKKIATYAEQHGLKVALAGKVPNGKLKEYYSRADLFLLMSRVEIFGMVILEAMACGCPVMSTPTPGALDVIRDGHNGFIIDTDDPSRIARRINHILLEREELRSVREEAVRTARKYSWPAIAGQYHSLYHGQING